MAYKSPFGNFAERAAGEDNGGYKSTFGNYAATIRKRQEEEEANRNRAEELRKEQEKQRQEDQKKAEDKKGLLEKAGDAAKGLGESIAAPFNRIGEGTAEVIGEVTGENQKIRDAHSKAQQDQIDTIKMAGKKMRDESLSKEERARWKSLFEKTAKDDTPYKEAQKYNQEQIEKTDPVKAAGAMAEIGLDIATAGTGGAALQAGKIAAKEGAKEVIKFSARNAAKKLFGEGAKGVAKKAGQDAAIGGGYGLTQTAQEKGGDATLDDYGKNLLFGATIGAAVPIAGKATGKVLRAGDKAAGRAVSRTVGETENENIQRALHQIGEDGIMGTLNRAFSRTGSKIAYAASDAANKTKLGSKVIDMKDDFMSKWVTEFHPLYKSLKRSDFEGRTDGAYLAAREAIGNSNRALSYAQDFVETNPNMQRLTASIAARDKDLVKALADFDEFAKVKSDLDLVAAGKKQFSESKVQELKSRMDKFKGKGYDNEYGDLVGFYKDLNKFRLDNGLISKEAFDQFEKEGFDYVRQQRELPDWMLDKPAGKGRGSAASITGSDAIQKRSKYASAELLSPTETAIKTAQLAHVEAYRNKAAKTVYGLLDDAGEAKLVKSTDMVNEKRALLKGLKETKPIVTKLNRAIRVHKNQIGTLKKEITQLRKQGRGELSKQIKAVLNDLDAKSAGKNGLISDRQMIDALVSLDSVELRKLRRMMESRDKKLEPLFDRLEALNGELSDVHAKRQGMWSDANAIKTTVNKGNQTTMSFLDDGTENVVKIDPAIASAVHNWDKQQQNVMNEVLRFSNNVFKYGTTGANAGFALPNFVADQVGSAVNSKSLMSTHNPVNFVHSLFMAMGKPLNAEDDNILRGYLSANKGQTSINQYTKKATSDKAANALIRKGARWDKKTYTVLRHPKEAMRALFDATEGAVGLTENVTRVQNYRGTFKKAVKEGKGENAGRLANQAARENSVDFLEMGSYGRVINSLIPYFNAAIQGSRTMLRNASERPVSFAAKTTALVGVPTAATTIWNTSDPDRKAIYDTIPDYVKDTNFIVITPEAKWNEKTKKWDGVWMMKKPPGFKEFAEPVRKFIEYKADDPNADLSSFLRDEGGSVAADFAGAMQPIDFSSPNKFLSSVTPQLLKPTAEAILNKNFFQGTDIVPDSLQGKDPADQKYENYSQLTSHIAAMFNTSPLKVDTWIRETFGEVGTNAVHYIDRATGAPENAQGGRSLPESIQRRFYGAQGGADTDAFYKSFNSASNARKRTSSTVTDLVKAGRINEAKRRAEDYNDSIKDRFSDFMKKYSDSPNYDPEWDDRINELFIPTTNRAFKARAKQD